MRVIHRLKELVAAPARLLAAPSRLIAGPRRLLDSVPTNASASGNFGWTSSNWSGYAIASNTNGSYRAISGTWTVPTVKASTQPSSSLSLWQWLLAWFGGGSYGRSSETAYSATWIGIDGFNNSNLIQAGTAQNIVKGKPQYYAWWEILPNPESPISKNQFPVDPGDEITCNIVQQSDGTWTIQLIDQTRGWTFTKSNISYSGPLSSVEWIEEAPEVGSSVATLADYGQVTFTACSMNGANPHFATSESGVMVQNGQQVSTPSAPSPSGDAFNIAYGSTQPTPPSS